MYEMPKTYSAFEFIKNPDYMIKWNRLIFLFIYTYLYVPFYSKNEVSAVKYYLFVNGSDRVATLKV